MHWRRPGHGRRGGGGIDRGREPDAPLPPVRQGEAAAAPDRAVSRAVFEQVIRRAAELTLSDADADDQLSESEMLRIATELGLPPHHVRRALYELPELSVQPRWYDRYAGPAVFSVDRVVRDDDALTLRRIEDYLVTREYLQIVRRRAESTGFVPADDTISSLARALFRPRRRHTMSRASRVLVSVHPLPDDAGHVRFDVDLSDARRHALRDGTVSGSIVGLIAGSLAAAISASVLPADAAIVPHILAFGGGLTASAAAGFSLAARRFRGRMAEARLELNSLLDRLEHGHRLDPPPAPWRRKLQLRLFGDRRP